MNYFDHAASSPIRPEVLDSLMQSLNHDFANPSAQHHLGLDLNEKIEMHRAAFLKILKAGKNDQFIFTSSATESNNTVVRGLSVSSEDTIIYCKADHPSITASVERLAELQNVKLKTIVLNKTGSVDPEYFASLLDPSVKLVILTHVNNQNGVIHDLTPLVKIIKSKSNAHVHVDAVQSFSKLPLDFIPFIDSMSVTAHKIGGPKGIAGLFLKEGHKVQPLLFGGNQEHGFRSSTTPSPLITGFHLAMKLAHLDLEAALQNNILHAERIKKSLKKIVSGIIFPFEQTSPYIISFIIPGVSSDIILRHLETKKVYISSTSACSSKISGFNPSLFAMNIPEKYHKNFLRVSLSSTTTRSEVEMLLEEFEKTWENIRHMIK